MSTPPLRLNKDQERRLLAGHCWIYSNEVDNEATPLKGFEPGQAVEVVTFAGRSLGYGYVNPHSLICARLVSHDRHRPLTLALWAQRIRTALELRERLYPQPFYRLVFGESDGLPGLIVDRFGDLLAVQITTAGMERARSDILTALEQVVRPKTIVLRNDTAVRELEGLAPGTETILGEPPGDLELAEHGARFLVSPLTGQKTGWFFDQAENRGRLARFGTPRRVLDVCSYIGAWSVRAARAGATEVIAVDSSAQALDQLQQNVALNGVEDRVSSLRGDAFQVLRELRASREHFDLVVLDPPAFIKRKKDLKEGMLAYRRLNELALSLIERDGVLVTASCSFHMQGEQLLRTVQQSARHTDRSLQLLHQGQQGPDHPIHPAIPETAYLKAFYLRVLPTL
jgi:23S rRNA (cytosine1962-C5)-methyltransferase